MKTVKQPAEVLFKSLDFADKVVMLPIIDRFANAIRTNCDISIMELNSHDNRTTEITIDNAKKMFKILSDLGCCTSLGESYEDIVKSNNSQEKQQKQEKQQEEEKEKKEEKEIKEQNVQNNKNEKCILALYYYIGGDKSKNDVTKILCDKLHIKLSEAKELIDFEKSYINLKLYNIDSTEYNELRSLLENKYREIGLITREHFLALIK